MCGGNPLTSYGFELECDNEMFTGFTIARRCPSDRPAVYILYRVLRIPLVWWLGFMTAAPTSLPNNVYRYPPIYNNQEKEQLKELYRGGGSRLTQSLPGRIRSKHHQNLRKPKGLAMRQATRYRPSTAVIG